MHCKFVYTVKEVSDILRISTKTVYQIIKSGELRSIRVRGQIRITSSALEKYIQGGENGPKGNAGNAI